MEKNNYTALLFPRQKTYTVIRWVIFTIYWVLLIPSFILKNTNIENRWAMAVSILADVAGAVSIIYFAITDTMILRSYKQTYLNKEYTMFFTSRKQEIKKVIQLIYKLWYTKASKIGTSTYINVYDNLGIGGNGKTEFLCKLESILRSNKLPREYCINDITKDLESKELDRFRKCIGYVFRCSQDDLKEYINNLPKGKAKKINILIIDDFVDDNSIPENNVLINYRQIRAHKGMYLDINTTCVELGKFSASDIQEYFSLKGNEITEETANKVLKMTDGSIHKLQCNLAIKEISSNIIGIAENRYNTELEEKLESVEQLMNKGLYEKAQKDINIIGINYAQLLECNNKFNYRYKMLNARVAHLLNRYSEALELLSTISDSERAYEENNDVISAQSHYHKHKGEFDIAIAMAKNKLKDYKLISLNILGYISELLINRTGATCLKDALSTSQIRNYVDELSKIDSKMQSTKFQWERGEYEYSYRYSDIFNYLISLYNGTPVLKLDYIEKSIPLSESSYSRLIANDLFIKAEIQRVGIINAASTTTTSRLKDLVKDYMDIYDKSIEFHDYNLQSQVECILFFLSSCYGISSINIDIGAVKTECIKKEMMFNAKMCSGLLEIVNKMPGEKYYMELFNNIPFIIL